MIQQLNYLIKPASGLCNMRCRYCFYSDEMAVRTEQVLEIMSAETSEVLIRDTFAAAPKGGVNFAFQGGEPTLAGLDYFRRFVALTKQYNTERISVSWAMQTNGLALTEEWATFLAENHFLVGVSVDGNKAIHDELRLDASGKGTWNRVWNNIRMLRKHGVEVNLLCVVTRFCAKRPTAVYNELKKSGIGYIQFIPCLDPLEEGRGSREYSLTPELYGSFLCGLFDEWYRDWKAGQYVSIRLFDDYVHLAMGLPSGTCATSGSCGSYLVVEGDGTLYPCDFYCLDGWQLGKVGDGPVESFLTGETEQKFLAEGRNHPIECADCRWQSLCSGGCKRDWVASPEGNHNYFCNAFRRFFAYAETRLAEVARAELQTMRRGR